MPNKPQHPTHKAATPTPPRMASRAALVCRGGTAPQSVDESTRSVAFVATTEAPVHVMDWEIWDTVLEVLRMDGVVLPASGRVPLLDSHERHSVGDVLGSFGDFALEPGQMTGRAYFSTAEEGEKAWIKTREGHVTDVSVGYEILEYSRVPEGETLDVNGTRYAGPLRVVTRWRLAEVSLCPIGADPAAKARTKAPLEGRRNNMPNDPKKRSTRSDSICEYLVDGTCNLTGGPVCSYLTESGCSKSVANSETPPSGDNDASGEAGSEAPTDALPGTQTAPDNLEGDEEQRAVSHRAALAERQRINEIQNMGRTFGLSEATMREHIGSGRSVNAVRASVMDTLAQRSQLGQGAGFMHASVGQGEGEKVRAAATHGLMLRCGAKIDKPAAGASEYRSMSMREIARDLLVRNGFAVPGNVKDLMGRALTTTDLPLLLTDSMHRLLLDAWEVAPTTWETWCYAGSVNDFKRYSSIDFAVDKNLPKVPESGEYTYGYASETGETYQLSTYGKIFPVTRQALINDDLGALTRIAAAHGEAAAVTINKLVYAVLKTNAKMVDGNSLFSAEHHNLALASGGAPTVENVGKMVKMMKQKKDIEGNLVQVRPQFFVAPTSIETAAEVFFSSQMIGTQAEPNRVNIYSGASFSRVYDAELDAIGGGSDTDWYLMGPAGKTVSVYFLDGNRTPRLEEKQGWSVDGVEWKVSIDAVATAETHLGMAKATQSAQPAKPTK